MFVNVKLFYRGTCPDEEYIKKLEKKLEMRFDKIELEEITESEFTLSSNCIAHIICPGNPELSVEDTLRCSYCDNYEMSVKFKWNYSLWYGLYDIYCEKGDYQVLTYSYSSNISWLLKRSIAFIKKYLLCVLHKNHKTDA